MATMSHSYKDVDSISGDAYIAQLARYIRANGAQLSASSTQGHRLASGHQGNNNSSLTSLLGVSGSSFTPLTLTLDIYHLYYVLLRVQEAGFADVGDMDELVTFNTSRRPQLPAASLAQAQRLANNDALSIKTGISRISKGVSSIGSSWWGSTASTSASAVDPATIVEADLRYIYTAFTLIPSLKLVLQDLKGKAKAIEGFDFPDLPGDRMLPLRAFKSLEKLELEGIDARILLFTGEWEGIKHLKVRDCGLEELRELLSCRKRTEDSLKWSPRLQSIDCEHNDLTQLDIEDLVGLERIVVLNLKRNLLLAVPTGAYHITEIYTELSHSIDLYRLQCLRISLLSRL